LTTAASAGRGSRLAQLLAAGARRVAYVVVDAHHGATFRQWDAREGDMDDPVDRAIAATRRVAFPELGLAPWDPR
jgi:hypothetical protein